MQKKILVIDDDKDIVSAIETILTMEDYTVFVAYSGKESFRLLHQEHPNLILLDYMLPDLNGEQIVEAIRSDREFVDLPIILISAAHGLKNIGKRIAVQGCIEKPFDLEELLSIVYKYTKSS